MHPIVKKLWEATPKPIQDAVAVTVDHVRGVEVPQPPRVDPSAPVRLFIAPANYAGQGYRWARAVEENPRVVARNMVYAEINPFGYPVDFPVRWRTVMHSRKWQQQQLAALVEGFTHVLIEAEFPPLGGMFSQSVIRQVRALQAGGVRVGMVCHGSDIRLPSRHNELETWSPFANDDWVPVEKLEKVMLGNKALLDELDLPTFVSTPGLLLDVPYAHLLPVVIDPELWRTDSTVLERDRPRVLHVPSNPLVKGTSEIEPALIRLHDKGIIEFVTVTGRTHEEMPAIYGSADIVLDQFRLGDYGVAACEAMAAGRLVVSHVSDQVRQVVEHDSGMALPIVEANIDSLERVLLQIIANREHYQQRAAEGPPFVKQVHNGRLARTVLERNFLNLDN